MQAYKLKGKINRAGNLVITKSVNLPSGDVEVIILQAVDTAIVGETQPQQSISERRTKIEAFQGWFEKTQPQF